MVAPAASEIIAVLYRWVVFAQEGESVMKRLDPATRAKVLATLAGFVILGIGLMVLAWLGSRATRRYMASGSGGDSASRKPKVDPDDWSKKPLQ